MDFCECDNPKGKYYDVLEIKVCQRCGSVVYDDKEPVFQHTIYVDDLKPGNLQFFGL